MKHINGFFGAITLEKAEQIPRGRGTFNPIFRAYIDWGPYPLLKGYLVTQQGARFPAAFFPLWILGPLLEGRSLDDSKRQSRNPFSPARAVQQRAPGWFGELLPPVFLRGVVLSR